MTTTLREAKNIIIIEGILAEKDIKVQTGQKGEFIGGEVIIRTDENSTHKVRVFANRLKKDGSENSIFKGLETVMNEYKSIAEVGEGEADRVRITNGKLGLNEYYNATGVLKSIPQISANFINRLKSDETLNPKAELEAEVVIRTKKPEMDKEGEETGRLILDVVLPVYGGVVKPLTITVEGEDRVSYIDSNYEAGNTVEIYANLVNTTVTEKRIQEVAFGKPKERVITNTVNEIIITGGSEPYEEENANTYDIELIKKALTERETFLEELKNKNNDKKSENKNTMGNKPSARSQQSNKSLPF